MEERTRANLGGAGGWTARWRIVHWVAIVLLLSEFVYATWMVFIVFGPPGGGLVLGAAATSMPPEWMHTRRMYALEAWVAFGALAIYLGVTEIAPRRWGRR